MPLPDAVMQGLGWAPPPVDSSLAGAPPTLPAPDAPPPLLPTIPGMGPAATPAASSPQPSATPAVTSGAPSLDLPPAPPITLPSAAAPAPPPAPPPDGAAKNPSADFSVPLGAVGGAPAPAPSHAAAPPRPATPDQRFAEQAVRADQATAEQQQAIADQTSVDRAKARGELEAMGRANARTQAIEDEQNLWRDEYKKTFAAKQAAVADATKAVDSYKVDPNKLWNEMGVGQHVGLYIAMALSGIGAALNNKGGEPNPVIAMLQQKAHESIVAQMDQRDQLEKKYGRAEHDLDRYEAFSKDRDAQLKLRMAEVNQSLARDIQTAAAKLGEPQAIARGEQLSGELHATAAKQGLEAIEKAATYDTQKKQLAVSQANAGIAASHLALDTKRLAWDQDKDQQQLNIEAAKLTQSGKLAAAKNHVERGIGGLTVDGKPLDPDGTNAFLAPSDKEAEKLRSQKAGIDTVNQFVNAMARGIKEHGGASAWLQSPEYQSMIAKKESLLFALHQAYGVEGFRPGVLEQMEKALGGTDPTSFFRSAVPGLTAAKDALNETFTNTLRVMDPRYKGEYKPVDTSNPGERVTTPEDDLKRDALSNPHRAYNNFPGRLVNELGKPGPDETLETRLKAAGDILPSVRRNLMTWGAALNNSDPAVQSRAQAILEEVSTKSESPEARALAAQILSSYRRDMSLGPAPVEMIRGAGGQQFQAGQ